MDDARSCRPNVRVGKFLFVLLLFDFHVRNAGLGHDEGTRQVGLNVCLPLFQHRRIRHGLPVGPVGVGDSSIVDEEVDPVVEKFGRLLDGRADFVDASQIAFRPSNPVRVLFQMHLGCVSDPFFVDVENEDLVTARCKVTGYRSSDA